METTVKERLLAFIEYKGMSKNKFETLCGLSKRYVSNISQSISPVVCKRISLRFPELNMGWLLTGEGEMLSGPGGQSRKPELGDVVLSGDMVKLFINMTETIKHQENNISVLTAMVDRLTGGKSQE